MWRKAPAIFAQIVFLGASVLCQNLVDINTASEKEIAALPRIGKALAKKIIEQRPYASIDDLAKAGVPPATRKLLKSKVTVSRTQDEKPTFQGGHIADSGVKATPMEEAAAPPPVTEVTRNAEDSRRREADAVRARAEAQEAQANAERERARAEASSATRAVEQARAAAEQARSSAVAEQRQMSAEADRQRVRALQEQAQLRRQLLDQLNSILQTHDTARGLIVNMPDVLFDTGQYALKPGAREKLAKISGLILAYPGLTISIEGHTDSTGSDDYNRTLSEKRATAVLDFLLSQGVPPSSLTVQGRGKSDPIADNSTAAGRQQNRRVDLVVSGVILGTPNPH